MKHKLLYILFLLTAAIYYGQVTLILAADEKDLKVNEPFNLRIVLEISGNEYEQESPLMLPDFSKFNFIGKASDQNTYVDSRKNIVINQIVYQVTLEPKVAGKVKIGSALVQVNGKIYKTEPFDIFVKEGDRKSLTTNSTDNNLYLDMEVKDRDIFQNEPTIAVLRAYSNDLGNFRKLGHLQFPEQQNINIKPISFQKSDIEPDYKNGMASQIIAIFMIFPKESGNITVPPVTASFKDKENNKIASNKIKLSVKKLPEGSPSSYKNAVGDFNLSIISPTNTNVEVNKPIDVEIKLSGKGNMNSVELPKLEKSTNYNFFEPKVSYHTISDKTGITGEISAKYVVVPLKPGTISVNTEDFSFFNPEEQKYVDVSHKSLIINTLTPEQISNSQSTMEKVSEYTNSVLETVDSPVLKMKSYKVIHKNKLNWSVILTNFGVLFGFVSVLMLFMRSKRKKGISRQITSPKVENISETEQKIMRDKKPEINEYLVYLDKLKNDGKYDEFFTSYSEMTNELEKYYSEHEGTTFGNYLESNFGSQMLENYRNLSQKMQMEKYAPLHHADNISELYQEISYFFNTIKE